MQRGLRMITLQGAIEKSPILLSQYWKNEWLDGNIIILYFAGSNNIFADCTSSIQFYFCQYVSSIYNLYSIHTLGVSKHLFKMLILYYWQKIVQNFDNSFLGFFSLAHLKKKKRLWP